MMGKNGGQFFSSIGTPAEKTSRMGKMSMITLQYSVETSDNANTPDSSTPERKK
jgi:hypothetical protein